MSTSPCTGVACLVHWQGVTTNLLFFTAAGCLGGPSRPRHSKHTAAGAPTWGHLKWFMQCATGAVPYQRCLVQVLHQSLAHQAVPSHPTTSALMRKLEQSSHSTSAACQHHNHSQQCSHSDITQWASHRTAAGLPQGPRSTAGGASTARLASYKQQT